MFMAVAAQTFKKESGTNDYRVWFLEMTSTGEVVGIGVMERKELVENVFKNFHNTGRTNWRSFAKGAVQSKPIEVYDFISQNPLENTHFGNLPTLNEFQKTLAQLEMNLEVSRMAS